MKKVIGLLVATLFLLLLTACPGLLDWHLALPNGYEISHVNAQQIILVCVPEGQDWAITVVSEQIVAYCANDRYVGIQQIVQGDYSVYLDDEYVDISYYLIDTKEGTVFGPYAEEGDYMNQVEENEITDLGEWVPTYPAPDDAEFPEFP